MPSSGVDPRTGAEPVPPTGQEITSAPDEPGKATAPDVTSSNGLAIAHADAARRRAELMASTAMHEAGQAQKQIDAFLAKAQAANLPVVELQARTLDGHLVKTNIRGWYLRNDHSVAVGTDGHYYQLTVPGGLMARLRGVHLQPTPPPLVVGRGGKDGETGDLKDFLDRALQGQVL